MEWPWTSSPFPSLLRAQNLLPNSWKVSEPWPEQSWRQFTCPSALDRFWPDQSLKEEIRSISHSRSWKSCSEMMSAPCHVHVIDTVCLLPIPSDCRCRLGNQSLLSSTTVAFNQCTARILKTCNTYCLVRGTDLLSLKLLHKTMTTANTTIAVRCEWINMVPIYFVR